MAHTSKKRKLISNALYYVKSPNTKVQYMKFKFLLSALQPRDSF